MVSLSIERSKQHDHDNKKEATGNNKWLQSGKQINIRYKGRAL